MQLYPRRDIPKEGGLRHTEESASRPVEHKPHQNSHLQEMSHILYVSDHPTLPLMLKEHSFAGLRAIAYTEEQVFCVSVAAGNTG